MKILKWSVIIIVLIAIIGFLGFYFMRSQTKKASPEDTVEYKAKDLKLSVFYCRPYKKDREIFGELVPYGEVWRTGANEATTFTTNKDIVFGEDSLAAGTYTLWTIPQKTQWTIILNSKLYGWGVQWGGKASREEKYDVLKINVPVIELEQTVEQFTIDFEYNVNLTMKWDKTKVSVPIRF